MLHFDIETLYPVSRTPIDQNIQREGLGMRKIIILEFLRRRSLPSNFLLAI